LTDNEGRIGLPIDARVPVYFARIRSCPSLKLRLASEAVRKGRLELANLFLRSSGNEDFVFFLGMRKFLRHEEIAIDAES
jgi:hypothetical protein